MSDPERGPCPRCAQPAALEAMICPHCRGSLAMDVAVVDAVADERQRYHIARALSALGPPLLGLVAIREALRSSPGVVARHLSPGAAARLIETLGAEHQIQGAARLSDTPAGRQVGPSGPTPTGTAVPGRRARPALALAAAALAIVAATGVLSLRWAAKRVLSVSTTDTLSPAALQDVANKVRPSTGSVHGLGIEGGNGFFVAPELMLALADPLGATVAQADYGQGQRGAASIMQADADLGLVLLQVPGAASDPLPLADATAVRDGDVLIVIDRVDGRLVARNTTVTNAAAERAGITLIQLEATLGGFRRGSPVLDTRGRAVGLISGSNPEARLAWVLPINYAFEWLPAPVAHDEAEWARRSAAFTKALQARHSAFAAVLQRPVLLQARYRGVVKYGLSQDILIEGFSMLVAAPAWAQTQGPASIRIRIGPCDLDAQIAWFPDRFRGNGGGRGGAQQAFERWTAAEGVRAQTVVGAADATLDRSRCPTAGAREVSLLHRGEAVDTVPLDD